MHWPGFVHSIVAATPVRSCFGGLIRSLPDLVAARSWPVTACLEVLFPGRQRRRPSERTSVAMPIVADNYEIVIGVDTHAAAHARCVVAAATGAVQDKASFPASPAGLDRARTWIAHRAGQQAAPRRHRRHRLLRRRTLRPRSCGGIPGSRTLRDGSADRRGVGKTDDLDAARIARSVLSVDIDRLRRPRADGSRVAMRVLVVAREQMTCERTRAVNALTALVRTVELGVDARKSLAYSQIKEIATGGLGPRTPPLRRAEQRPCD